MSDIGTNTYAGPSSMTSNQSQAWQFTPTWSYSLNPALLINGLPIGPFTLGSPNTVIWEDFNKSGVNAQGQIVASNTGLASSGYTYADLNSSFQKSTFKQPSKNFGTWTANSANLLLLPETFIDGGVPVCQLDAMYYALDDVVRALKMVGILPKTQWEKDNLFFINERSSQAPTA